jgi:hypothetical protein
MLNGEGCQELGHLHGLAASSEATVLQDVPDDMGKLAGGLYKGCGKRMACLRLFIDLRRPMPQP